MAIPFVVSGNFIGLLMLVVIMGATVYFTKRAQGGKVQPIRRVPGIDAMDEAIGRSVEMGRPVVASHGIASLRDATTGPQTIAGLSVLSYVAKKTSEVGAELIVPVRSPEVWPIAADIVETAYKVSGKAEDYKVENIRFLSNDQFAYSSNYIGLLMREKPGANIMIGAYWAESLQLAETGSRVGCMQISGTAQTSQLPFFLVATDYCLIGEEIYSAGAYLTNDAQMIGSLAGTDVGRIIAVALSLLGALIVTLGSQVMIQFFGW